MSHANPGSSETMEVTFKQLTTVSCPEQQLQVPSDIKNTYIS
jgi:hypothetical protein